MRAGLQSLLGATAEKEFQCKKIVALCTGLPIDKVEDVSGRLLRCSVVHDPDLVFLVQMLENLLIAVESEAQIVDLGRVSGFMQKVGQM